MRHAPQIEPSQTQVLSVPKQLAGQRARLESADEFIVRHGEFLPS
jgi:hypothetical protein